MQRGGLKKKRVGFEYVPTSCTIWWHRVRPWRGGSGWWSTMNKRVVFLFIFFFMHLPATCQRPTPFYANYYYFSPYHKTKADSRRLVVRTHVRDFFYHNEERFCACFKHSPLTLTRLSPRCRGPPPDYNI